MWKLRFKCQRPQSFVVYLHVHHSRFMFAILWVSPRPGNSWQVLVNYSWIVLGGDGTVKSHFTFRLTREKWHSWQINRARGVSRVFFYKDKGLWCTNLHLWRLFTHAKQTVAREYTNTCGGEGRTATQSILKRIAVVFQTSVVNQR